MALIHNQNDLQNMFSKAGKITSEKYIVFQHRDDHPVKKFSTPQPSKSPDLNNKNALSQQESLNEAEQNHLKHLLRMSQPFTKQISRKVGHYTQIGNNCKASCGQYHIKYSELDKAVHSVPHYDKTLKHTIPVEVPHKHQQDLPQEQVPLLLPQYSLHCRETQIQIREFCRSAKTNTKVCSSLQNRADIFSGRPNPHPDRFQFLNVTNQWSKIPRQPQIKLEKQLSRDQMLIYKKKEFAPDYKPNFEFGKKQLGSCGAPFYKLEQRKDILTKIPPYNFESYFEYDQYSKQPKSQLFTSPTAPNFKTMLDRECDQKSLLPSFMQKFTNTRMGITHLNQKMLEVNNFKDGRFLTVTSSFMPTKQKQSKQTQNQSSQNQSFDEI
ncbi:unnamed protein product (macronuclear) [Paramecium tetraurelia]|uniref:Uncharacterized protein n=1 Tax=Paramecium tetraurelia TaxID=5888 RepID=A0BWC7_PARTE|nr:uncharacterized protein GSPATT00032696001 [Paramecium tetraurelia]CAK62844.1 unnamed protein product [Paramecium tetraurelia]|eukprot:XP_001430242.1 hypothetical protein (macronuclear) [Paramecium tetraurelia strain d4-2]